jgi:hypothetical protein
MQDAILRLLQGVKWKADKRKIGGTSALLGQTWDCNTGLRLSCATRHNLELTAALCGYMRARDPDFCFSAIHVCGGAKELHVDGRNSGRSFMKTWGDYTGGELWVLGSPPLDLREGAFVDGTIPHATLPFAGERYCVVFYGQWSRHKPMPPEEQELYDKLGFPPAPSEWPKRVPRHVLDARMQQACELFGKFRIHSDSE